MGVRLPAKYQEVEYITGIRQKQFINTGISGDNDGLVIEARVKPGGYVQYAPLWGNYQAENYKCTRLIATEMTGQIYSYINTKASNGTNRISYSLFNGNNIYDIRQEKTKVIINGTAYITTSVSGGLENTTPIAINASRIDPNHPASDYLQSFYYFRISDGETVLIDLVPCYRKSDDKPGMYDLVTKQFFTNAGTGEFTVGPDVIDSISPLMVARRRMLMRQYIGYEENKGFTGVYSNVSTGVVNGRFLTGFIPINGAKRVTCYYGGNITSGTMHYMVEYNGDKQYTNKDGYWDMTVKNQRTVTLYTSDVQYVRFSGFMNEIDQCYVKNADTGEILWKKGM